MTLLGLTLFFLVSDDDFMNSFNCGGLHLIAKEKKKEEKERKE